MDGHPDRVLASIPEPINVMTVPNWRPKKYHLNFKPCYYIFLARIPQKPRILF